MIDSVMYEYLLRLLVAGLLGAAVGLEREYRAKEAGYRTHFLVCLGSALMMIVSKYGFDDHLVEGTIRLDPSRIAAQVVTGIGFIGAGTIIFQKQIVRGLTTAAGIWATAGIGLAVGAGMYFMSITCTILVLIGLEVFRRVFKGIGVRSVLIEFTVGDKATLDKLADYFSTDNYRVTSYEMSETSKGYTVTEVIKLKKDIDEGELFKQLQDFKDVTVHRLE
ncbi:MAG: MgtC/SapB family protein [Bacteroidales bacterium]|jgi:putative Mg2+ transporter-C (MgtC) family protein|nr:MgtC/SapB family protein [Bacteroidales bacterium]MCI1733379.1 MgtC/SapB family protein [Bacteroidales bacterium]